MTASQLVAEGAAPFTVSEARGARTATKKAHRAQREAELV